MMMNHKLLDKHIEFIVAYLALILILVVVGPRLMVITIMALLERVRIVVLAVISFTDINDEEMIVYYYYYD